MKALVLDELRKEEERGEGWVPKRTDKNRDENRRYKRTESSDEQEEERRRRKQPRSGSLDELEEEGEDEDLEEGYSEDKEVLKEVLNLRFSNLNKKKIQSEEKKNEVGMSSSGTRKDALHSKGDSDTDDEDQVELVFVRRTNTGAWGRAAGGVISSGGVPKPPPRSTFTSRASVGSNIGGLGSASRSSLSSRRGSISETVAAITAHRSSLSSGSLLSSRASTSFGSSRTGTGRISNAGVGSSTGRPNSTASAGNRPQNRRGSGLSLTSLGISGNVASSGYGNTGLSGGGGTFSLDEGDETKGSAEDFPGNETNNSGATVADRRRDSANKATGRINISASEDDKYDDESCDGVVTRLLDRSILARPEDKGSVRILGANMLRCASWVTTKVSCSPTSYSLIFWQPFLLLAALCCY